jgi:hypothetical protein
MYDPRQILYFAVRFVLIFALLVLPWPFVQTIFSSGYRSGAQAFLGLILPQRLVIVEPYREIDQSSVDIKISIGNPRESRPDGLIPVKEITLDSRSMGWMPLAMFVALWGATPLSRPQRLKMLVAGIGGILSLIVAILLASACPGLLRNVGWQQVLSISIHRLLVDNLWISFVGPAMIWLGCLFACGAGVIPLAKRA